MKSLSERIVESFVNEAKVFTVPTHEEIQLIEPTQKDIDWLKNLLSSVYSNMLLAKGQKSPTFQKVMDSVKIGYSKIKDPNEIIRKLKAFNIVFRDTAFIDKQLSIYVKTAEENANPTVGVVDIAYWIDDKMINSIKNGVLSTDIDRNTNYAILSIKSNSMYSEMHDSIVNIFNDVKSDKSFIDYVNKIEKLKNVYAGKMQELQKQQDADLAIRLSSKKQKVEKLTNSLIKPTPQTIKFDNSTSYLANLAGVKSVGNDFVKIGKVIGTLSIKSAVDKYRDINTGNIRKEPHNVISIMYPESKKPLVIGYISAEEYSARYIADLQEFIENLQLREVPRGTIIDDLVVTGYNH